MCDTQPLKPPLKVPSGFMYLESFMAIGELDPERGRFPLLTGRGIFLGHGWNTDGTRTQVTCRRVGVPEYRRTDTPRHRHSGTICTSVFHPWLNDSCSGNHEGLPFSSAAAAAGLSGSTFTARRELCATGPWDGGPADGGPADGVLSSRS